MFAENKLVLVKSKKSGKRTSLCEFIPSLDLISYIFLIALSSYDDILEDM